MTLREWYQSKTGTADDIDDNEIRHLWTLTKISDVHTICCLVCLNHHNYDAAFGYLEYLINSSTIYLDDVILSRRLYSKQAGILVKLIDDNSVDVLDMASQMCVSYSRSLYVVISYIHFLILSAMPGLLNKYPDIQKEKAYLAIGTNVIKKHLLSLKQINEYYEIERQ